MPRKLVDAYSSRTGRKLARQVPESWLERFPTLRQTPRSRSKNEPGLPARSASKADWTAHAVSAGMSAEDAEAMTRDQLAKHFHTDDQEV